MEGYMKPRKHAELIKAWADGAEIETLACDGKWHLRPCPEWYESCQYRIKPQPKPDLRILQNVLYAPGEGLYIHEANDETANLKLVFDGSTNQLKSAEVI
jgi:hypothetical protein